MDKLNYKNMTVLITGHTGFKGAWLSLWLQELGAKVYGISLEPETTPNLFTVAKVGSKMLGDYRVDIRNFHVLNQIIERIQPEIVFHLAAQPLVQYSYDNPRETYEVNVLGTINVFEALRQSPSIKAIVNVTSDKCYENFSNNQMFDESARLGGFDPYSNSKACAELVTSAYRRSYFEKKNINLASVRAGNVIGGGDWAKDRLVPDAIRAFQNKKPLTIRNPNAIRPWQHVLEPLYGYLKLGKALLSKDGQVFAEAWNFGPVEHNMQTVTNVIEKVSSNLDIEVHELNHENLRYESVYLKINSTKAASFLKWYPLWDLDQTIDETLAWYLAYFNKQDMNDYCLKQIKDYMHCQIYSNEKVYE